MKLYEFVDHCISTTSNDFDEKSNDALVDFIECIKQYTWADVELTEEPEPTTVTRRMRSEPKRLARPATPPRLARNF